MGTAIRTPEAPETIFTVVDDPFATALLPDPDLEPVRSCSYTFGCSWRSDVDLLRHH